jgi:Glycosyl transferase family 2
MPKVSAVIPSRNRPQIVRRAVQSALSQTFTDLEVVVVVDGPDATTVKVLEQMNDPRVRVIELEESVGASEARNVGAARAHGKWIALLDDDDEWQPTKIEKQFAAAEAVTSKFALVVCSFVLKTETTEAVAPRRLPRPGEPISEYLFGSPRNGFQTSGFLCSRDLMLQKPWRRLKGLQDIDWFLRVTCDPDVQLAIVPDPLCVYWTESENTITSKLGWQTCLEWGQANRSLMTRRAYSSFIAKVCAPRAASQQAGASVTFRLLRELLLKGSPTFSSLLMFAAYSVLPYKTRRRLANMATALKEQIDLLNPRTYPKALEPQESECE